MFGIDDAVMAIGGGALLGGLFGGGGSSQSGTSTSTSTTEPWSGQKPYLTDLYSRAQTLLNQGSSNYLSSEALQGMKDSLNSGLSNKASSVISNTLGSNPLNNFGIGQRVTIGENPYLTGGMDNPYLKQSIANASKDAMDNLNSNMNNAIRSSGSFGNSGVEETYGKAAGNALGSIANNAYMNQFNTNLGMTNSNNLAQANLNMAGLNNDISQYNQGVNTLNNAAFNVPGFNVSNMSNYGTLMNAAQMNNDALWNPLKNYGSLVGIGNGSSTTSSSPIYSNPGAGILGGALAGAQLGKLFF